MSVRLTAMTLGGCAALAVGVLAIGIDQQGAPEAGTHVQPEAASPLQSTVPEHPWPSPSLRLAQPQYGTVCQTPGGNICTVNPVPINSRCDCGGTYGVVVR